MPAHSFEYMCEECYVKRHGPIPQNMSRWLMSDGYSRIVSDPERWKKLVCDRCGRTWE